MTMSQPKCKRLSLIVLLLIITGCSAEETPIDDTFSDKSKTSSSLQVPKQLSSPPAIKNDSESGWARYENEEFNYSIDYRLNPQWTSLNTEEDIVLSFEEFQIPLKQRTSISQGHVVNLTQVYITDDVDILKYLAKDEPLSDGPTFSGFPTQEFHFKSMGFPYGYVIEKNGTYYVFESTDGPVNDKFEHMMQSLEFTE